MAFAVANSIALREIWRGCVWKARPAIVVHDDDELLALWTPDGAAMRIADTGDGIPAESWRLVPFAAELDALRLWTPGAPRMHVAVWRGGSFQGWKVDVIRPLRRFGVGFEYLDLELDVSVDPAGEAAIVDEDEFLESRRRGVIEDAEATAVRREAESALGEARRRAWPFSEGWERWRPDPAWPSRPSPKAGTCPRATSRRFAAIAANRGRCDVRAEPDNVCGDSPQALSAPLVERLP